MPLPRVTHTPPAPRVPRARDFRLYVVYRPLTFVLWSLVLWGTLLDLGFAFSALHRGPEAALRAITASLERPVAWVNLVLAAFAPVAWGFVWWALRKGRAQG